MLRVFCFSCDSIFKTSSIVRVPNKSNIFGGCEFESLRISEFYRNGEKRGKTVVRSTKIVADSIITKYRCSPLLGLPETHMVT